MKKVKILFTAILAIALVGGALAFKAEKFNGLDWYCDDNDAGTVCDDVLSFDDATISDTPTSGDEVIVSNVRCTLAAFSSQSCQPHTFIEED